MNKFIPKKPENLYIGFETEDSIYIREGYFTEKIIINSDNKYYEKLLNLLDGEKTKMFIKTDIEYRFIQDIFLGRV